MLRKLRLRQKKWFSYKTKRVCKLSIYLHGYIELKVKI